MARRGRRDLGLQRFDRDGLRFALDAAQDFKQKLFRVVRRDRRGRFVNGHAPRADGRNLEAVCGQLFADALYDRNLLRRKFHDDGHQQALAGERALAAGAQMLLEQHALVSHMLVDDPEAVFVYREDERISDLA